MERRIHEDDWKPTRAQAALIRDKFDENNRQRGDMGPLAWDPRVIDTPSFYTRLSWSMQLRHRFKNLYALVQRMKELGSPPDVRAVYSFWRVRKS
jgi:hypothetical protein